MVSTRKSRGGARRGILRRMVVKRSPGRMTKAGMVQVTITLAPKHVEALKAEAFRRAAETGYGKPDASAIIRELVDAWLSKLAKK